MYEFLRWLVRHIVGLILGPHFKISAKLLYVRLKYYRTWNKKGSVHPLVVSFINEDGPGLADILKICVASYYIAAKNNLPFKFSYTAVFDIKKYLQPNKIDWLPRPGEISYSTRDTKIIPYSPYEPVPLLNKKDLQTHIYSYTGYDIINVQEPETWRETWHDIFYELFTPTEYFKKLMCALELPENFVSVHFRFLNSLENQEKRIIDSSVNRRLPKARKKEFIDQCLKTLEKIQECESGKTILVFSDSEKFLNIAAEKGYSMLPHENIGHPFYFPNNDAVYDKIFTDFYAISKSSVVYSVQDDEGHLYGGSMFAVYASVIGKVPYKILKLEKNS